MELSRCDGFLLRRHSIIQFTKKYEDFAHKGEVEMYNKIQVIIEGIWSDCLI